MATSKKSIPVEKQPREAAPVQRASAPDRADVKPERPSDAPTDSAVTSLASDIKKKGFEAESWYDEGANLIYARAHNDEGHNRLLSMTPEELSDGQLKKEFVIRLTAES